MNLPAEFTQQTRTLLGVEEYEKMMVALSQESLVSIRLNPWKQNKTALSLSDLDLVPIPWCTDGYYLNRRLTFTFDPLFHAGCYYVQEASSMFLEQALNQYVTVPVVMLDLCAAPGGKSTHARSVLPEGSLLVANEVIHNRSKVLAENITKWGHPDVVVANNEPADFGRLGSFFDIILADVPCSGEGMFRKDPQAISEWSLANIDLCRQRQRRIITDIWPCLKPGGLLIYSTCTYNTKENEENVAWFMKEFGAEPLPVAVASEWNITGNLSGRDFPVYRFFPHRTKGEGFFLAVLRKTEEEDFHTRPGDKKVMLNKHLRVVRSLDVDSLLSHALAMSITLKPDQYPTCELTYEQAIAYLRREAIVLDPLVPRGHILVTYKNLPLGFVKNIGNRANNLYPQNWRIRSGYLPDEIRIL